MSTKSKVNDWKGYLDELPPTQDVLDMYKSKLEKCRIDYDSLLRHLQTLKLELEDRGQLEEKLQTADQEMHLVRGMLSRTQALLLTERSNSQQMALHIDILRKQHEMDREKLDLMLSLNGRPIPNLFQGEAMLRQQIFKLDRLMKEQEARLLEERSVMKNEWDSDRRSSEKTMKSLRTKIQRLQEQLILANEHRVLRGQSRISDFLSGRMTALEDCENFYPEDWCQSSCKESKSDHCSNQEMKRLKKKVEELQQQSETYQRRCVTLTTTIKELKDDLHSRQEKFQSQTKACMEQIERLREENKRLNQRRLTEGSGFRAEIKLLREQLQRTQRQLCFLTVRKLEEEEK